MNLYSREKRREHKNVPSMNKNSLKEESEIFFHRDSHYNIVPILETNEFRMMEHHLVHGFCVLTAFRSDKPLAENRGLNAELKRKIRNLGYGVIPVVGGYMEPIKETDPRYIDPKSKDAKNPKNDIKIIKKDDDTFLEFIPVLEESFVVPCFDVTTGEPLTDDEEIKQFKEEMMELGREYEQDSILIAPPKGKGKACSVFTQGEQFGKESAVYTDYTLANATDRYFTMKEKTLKKAREKHLQGVYGTAFWNRDKGRDSIVYVESFVKGTAKSISEIRAYDRFLEYPCFGTLSFENAYVSVNGRNKKVKFIEESIAERWGVLFD